MNALIYLVRHVLPKIPSVPMALFSDSSACQERELAAIASNMSVRKSLVAKAQEVAEAVRYCFESTFNVNKIVIQKNAR